MVLSLGAACTGGGPVTIAASGPTAPARDPAATKTCTSPAAGYSVGYPATWFTVGDGPVPCRFFDPRPFRLPADTEVTGLSIVAEMVPVSFDEIVPPAPDQGDPRVLDRREERLTGRRALRIDTRTTGGGLLPARGHRVTWYLDAGAGTFVATTTAADTGESSATPVDVLDRMVASLRLLAAAPEQA
ncbi:MAG: hypothetical protein M3140_04825 [Actinomycetota bacterium]|nr:hypothetical protein [Actinomycetota bacterium]